MLLVPVSLDITPDTGELKRDASRKHSPKQKKVLNKSGLLTLKLG